MWLDMELVVKFARYIVVVQLVSSFSTINTNKTM